MPQLNKDYKDYNFEIKKRFQESHNGAHNKLIIYIKKKKNLCMTKYSME